MKVFITGALSFIGSEVVRQLRLEGAEVTGIDVGARGEAPWAPCDVRDPEVARHIPEGVDAVIHLAALSRDPDCKGRARECFDVNVMGTLNVIEAAARRGARQFIFASSEWVYDSFPPGCPPKTEESPIDPANLRSEYALSKLVSEANLRQRHGQGFCPVAILRFGIVHGPRLGNPSAVESIFESVATKDEVVVGSLRTGRHFIHVSDVASAVRASIGLGGCEVLNVQHDRLITLGEIIEASQEVLERRVKVTESDPARPSVRPVSNEKIKRLLGWRPRVGLADALLALKAFREARR